MSITITTWNVQNFTRSDLVFADKLNFLVGTLQALDSDVVALQEILDLNALQELANRLDFHHVAAMPTIARTEWHSSPATPLYCHLGRSTSGNSPKASRFATSTATGASRFCHSSRGLPFRSRSRTMAKKLISLLHT